MIQLKFDWQKIMETRQLYWQKCYEYIISNETVGNYHTDDYKKELLNLMTLERDGGNCGSCGINWKKISFLYNGQECYYFVPDCYCYKVCKACGEYLYDVQFLGILKDNCTNCGVNLSESYV